VHLGKPSPPERRRRIALYSHDTMGLGHIRRNILIAAALVADHPQTDVLLLTGAPEAAGLPLPPSTDVVTLPTLRKHADGHYSPRQMSCSLDELLRTRSSMIEAALTTFDPDLVVIDKVARGVGGELDAALSALRSTGLARVVLGLRDVLDAPGAARRDWDESRTTQALRELYDAVWVYGDPDIFDPVLEYHLSDEVAGMLSYTGYLAGRRPACLRVRHQVTTPPTPPGQPFVLCLVGGGQDGRALAGAFAETRFPEGHHGVVLIGSHMPVRQQDALMRQAQRREDLTVHDFVPGADDFIRRASAAVSMGGYNSVCELLAARRPTLLVPRVEPRAEQAVRAERLARAGWVDTIHPSDVTPGRLSHWLCRAVHGAPRPRRDVDRMGLSRLPRLAEELLDRGVRREVPDVAV
jgi:predicted glycosyltransferase